ncbi:uracil-DNA glycosylase-like protein [Sphaerosporella brunnea]|uniref:Uracil-DNA glycosylase-like protein n=1 Tax=Sphaerosporella brunnea TaxID=1250544 RepID=A0A5J5EPN2_9PEZI|nr:uracil-DNA glycosylase-like protein [Sphaerosporella brunnea]
MSKRAMPRAVEEEEDPDKPTATFGGALSKFAFPATTRVTRSNTRSASASPQKRARSPVKEEPSEDTEVDSKEAGTKSKKKKRSKHPGYAPPSKYAHLSGIPDSLSANLICVFVGTNPGLKTAIKGHAYSSPSNLFWKLLHQSGLTPDQKRLPTDDLKLPELYSLGNTNLVSRPTKDQAELSHEEMEEGVPILEAKVQKFRPESVCIVGKGIWERIYKAKSGKKLGKEFQFGWQDGWRLGAVEGEYEGAKVYVAVSTSGLVAGYSTAQKLRIMTELGDWVNLRRKERGETAPRVEELEQDGLKLEEIEESPAVKLEEGDA